MKKDKKTKTLYTNRNEMLILEFNKDNKIVGIELLDSKNAPKPCMVISNNKSKKD